jgi:hypothetical protein
VATLEQVATFEQVTTREPAEDAVPIVVDSWQEQSLPPAKPFYCAATFTADGTDQFLTTSKKEQEEQCDIFGYFDEGTTCKLWTTHVPGTTPLYRLWTGIVHLYTTNEQEKNRFGYPGAYQGIAGYVLPVQREGTVPFYRIPHLFIEDSFDYIVCDEERHRSIQNDPWATEVCLGFVMPPQKSSSTYAAPV